MKNGFTLIELLIVIAITIIIAAASVPIYGNLQVSSQLNENTSQIIQTLRIAKERSIARVNNASHGVYFEINPIGDDRFILYEGSSYATRNSVYDREVIVPTSLSFSTSDFTLTGGQDIDINFSKGLGSPDNTGDLTINHEVSGSRSLTVNSLGTIREN